MEEGGDGSERPARNAPSPIRDGYAPRSSNHLLCQTE
jgi:hypothetical protein